MTATEKFCGECGWAKPEEPVEVKVSPAAAVRQALAESVPFPEEVTQTRILDIKNGVDLTKTPKATKEEVVHIPTKEEYDDYTAKMEAEAKLELEEYKASHKTHAALPAKSSMPSKGVIAGIVLGTLIISAGIGGFFLWQGQKSTTTTQPVVAVPVTPPQEVAKPVEPTVEPPKAEVAQEPVVKPEPPKAVETPKVEAKKAQKPIMATTKPIVKPKTEAVRDTMPAKAEPVRVETAAETKDVGHVVGEVQSWLRSNGYNVVASVKDNKLVLKGIDTGTVLPAEKAKIMAKVKSYGVPVRDLIVVDTN